MKKFTPFWFEGNQWFKMVNNESDLDALFEVYKGVCYSREDVLKARECVRDPSKPLKFGFRVECSGERTLSDFLSQ